MKETNRFSLKLFDALDKFDYNVLNENWTKIDDALPNKTMSVINASDDSIFIKAVNERLVQKMPISSVQHFQFSCNSELGNQQFHGVLWKLAQNFAVIKAVSEIGDQVIRYCNNDGWESWEWVNPPMETGVQYRTNERYNGNVVYVKKVDIGTFPNAALKSTSFCDSSDVTVVSFDAYCNRGHIIKLPYVSTNSDDTSGKILATAYCMGKSIYVKTFSNLSDVTGWAIIKYTI